MQSTICTGCSSDQTEKMITDHDDYLAYRCHSCGNLFQLVPDVYEYVTVPLDRDRLLHPEEFMVYDELLLEDV
jgi:uncharacterized Zn finger protein